MTTTETPHISVVTTETVTAPTVEASASSTAGSHSAAVVAPTSSTGSTPRITPRAADVPVAAAASSSSSESARRAVDVAADRLVAEEDSYRDLLRMDRIAWRKAGDKNIKKFIRVADLRQVLTGEESPLFKKKVAAELCLSLVSESQSLNLEAPSRDVRDKFAAAFKWLLKRNSK